MSETKSSKVLTTGFGIPVGDDQNSLTAGERGPVLTCFVALKHFPSRGMKIIKSIAERKILKEYFEINKQSWSCELRS